MPFCLLATSLFTPVDSIPNVLMMSSPTATELTTPLLGVRLAECYSDVAPALAGRTARSSAEIEIYESVARQLGAGAERRPDLKHRHSIPPFLQTLH